MSLQIRQYLAIRRHEFSNQLGSGDMLAGFASCARGGSYQTFDFEFIGVDQQPNERLLIVGIGTDIGEHEQSGPFSTYGCTAGEQKSNQ